MLDVEAKCLLMRELGAVWFDYVCDDHHKDRDCHFNIDCAFSYGEGPKFSAAHFGYIDDGFGHASKARGAAGHAVFDTFEAALDFCIQQTLAMLRRHYTDLKAEHVQRVVAAKQAWEARK